MDDEKSFFNSPLFVVIASLIVIAATVGIGYQFILGGSGSKLERGVGSQWSEIVDDSEFYVFNMKKIASQDDLITFANINEESLEKVEKYLKDAKALRDEAKHPDFKARYISFLTAYRDYLIQAGVIIRNPSLSTIDQEIKELKLLGEDAARILTPLENNHEFLDGLFEQELFSADKYFAGVASANAQEDIIE